MAVKGKKGVAPEDKPKAPAKVTKIAPKDTDVVAVSKPGAPIELFQFDDFAVSNVGLNVTGEPSFDAWAKFGTTLHVLGSAAQWAIGDWLNFGESRYGEKYEQAQALTNRSYSGIANMKWVSQTFPQKRRVAGLSWAHHREVAGLDAKEADALLEQALTEGMTREQLRDRVREKTRKAKIDGTKPAVAGSYRIVYVDTCCDDDQEGMIPSLDWLKSQAEQFDAIADDECIVAMWARPGRVDEAIGVLAKWGASVVGCAVGVSNITKREAWFRERHELLLLARRGSLVPATGAPPLPMAPDGVLDLEHKHEQAADALSKMFPDAPAIDVFGFAGLEWPSAKWPTAAPVQASE